MKTYLDELTIDGSTLKFSDSKWVFHLDFNIALPGLAWIHFIVVLKGPPCSAPSQK